MKHPIRPFLLLAFLPFAPLAAQELDLHLACKKGDKQTFKHSTVITQSIDMGGQQMEVGSTIVHVLGLEVTGVGSDGSVEAVVKVLRSSGSMQLPMATEDVTFDSAVKDAEGDEMGIGAALTSFVGMSFPVKVSRNGVVKEIKGAEAALKAAREKTNPMAQQMLGGQLNESTLQRVAQSVFGYLPEKPVSKGGTWDREVTNDSRGMKMVTSSRYALGVADDKQVELNVTGTLATPQRKAEGKDAKAKEKEAAKEEEGTEEVQAMMRTMKIKKGVLSGKDLVARDSGLILSSKAKIELSFSLESQMGELAIDQVQEITIGRATEADMQPAKKPAKDEKKKEGGK